MARIHQNNKNICLHILNLAQEKVHSIIRWDSNVYFFLFIEVELIFAFQEPLVIAHMKLH